MFNGVIVSFLPHANRKNKENVYIVFSYDYEIVAALYDQNGELLFINTEMVSGIGVHPGSTITVRLYIYEDILMYFCREGLTPTTVDALVYCEK